MDTFAKVLGWLLIILFIVLSITGIVACIIAAVACPCVECISCCILVTIWIAILTIGVIYYY